MSIFNDKALKGVSEAVAKIMEAEKMAKKDHDQDGKIETGKAEYLGSRIRAAKMAGKMKEEVNKNEYHVSKTHKFPTKDEHAVTIKHTESGREHVHSGKGKYLSKLIKTRYNVSHHFEDVELNDVDQLDEAFPTVADGEKSLKAKEGKTSSGTVTKTKTGLVHKRDYKDDDNDADDTPKKSKGYGARQNMGKRGQSDGTKKVKSMKESVQSLNEGMSEDDYHNHATNYPLHNITGDKGGTLHSHSLKYLHDAHAHHEYARDMEEPSEGGGKNGAAAKAVKHIEKHVSQKYGKEAGAHLANSHTEGNFHKVLGAAKKHMATMKESKLSFTEMLHLYNESGVEVIAKIMPEKVKFGDTEVEVIDANIVNGAVGITVAEEVDNETFTKEVEAQKEKNAGKGKKAEVAKASVQAVEVQKEETEQLDEISKKTLGSYIKAASHDVAAKGAFTRHFADKSRAETAAQRPDLARKSMKQADKVQDAGMKRRANMAKAVDRLTKEEVEQIDERTLTSGETKKKEDYVKGMKKSVSGFKARYGDRAKEVMYATATKMAKKD